MNKKKSLTALIQWQFWWRKEIAYRQMLEE
jgi:hypothetical protein